MSWARLSRTMSVVVTSPSTRRSAELSRVDSREFAASMAPMV